MSQPEEWRPVPGMAGVLASSWGRVQVLPYERAMPKGGYRVYSVSPTFGVWSEDAKRFLLVWRRRTYKVHRLVATAFHGPAPFPRAVVMHRDEDSRHNRPGNLTWGTQRENLNAPGFLTYCRSRVGGDSPWAKHRAAHV